MVWCVGEIYLFQVYAKSDVEKRATKGIISNLINRLIIMLDEETVMKYAQDERIPFTTYKSLTQAPQIIRLIQKEVNQVNKKLARVEQIKKFRLLDIKLTSEDGELTATMKLKRRMINDKYSGFIEEMYKR